MIDSANTPYNFWLHAKEETKPKPSFGFGPGLYQKGKHSIISLSRFAQQREAAERQEQAQQLRIKPYRNQGPKLGGQGMG
ncbi:MAG: hypothetical protein EOO39_09295 [Cytophagaceae bacterium]|nr:MAG: hypothetical protein EOO39_09295 [Cytophagaceae bacterium]